MKILLSAFACAPNAGSESGGGWHYAMQLAKDHEVWVLTDESRRAAIEGDISPRPRGLHIHYFRPKWLCRLNLNSRTAHVIYQAWQYGAWKVASALDAEHDFDFCWHLTYGVFRQPSWMWKVGKPFVFGPVGGGERAPMRLRKSMPLMAKFSEALRDTINSACWLMPGLRATYQHANLVIARTEDTHRILPKHVQPRTVVQQEIGGYAARVDPEQRTGHTGELRILFAGRLLALKGVHLAIDAIAQFIKQGGRGSFTVIGEGSMKRLLQKLAARRGVTDYVHFIGHVRQDELFRMYAKFDLLLFPSLHDSGGNVVIEALSFGMPVVCLDLGGPCCFVNESCGIVIPTTQKTEEQIVAALAGALLRLHADQKGHRQLCHGALATAAELTWEKQIDRVMHLIEQSLPRA